MAAEQRSLVGATICTVSSIAEWDRRTAELLEDAYVTVGEGPGGSGSSSSSEGDWRAKRQHLAIPMDSDGDWLDVGCANGHLLATLPVWARERGLRIEPFGLELLPRVADLPPPTHPPKQSLTNPRSIMIEHRGRSVTGVA